MRHVREDYGENQSEHVGPAQLRSNDEKNQSSHDLRHYKALEFYLPDDRRCHPESTGNGNEALASHEL